MRSGGYLCRTRAAGGGTHRPFTALIAEWIADRYKQTAYQDDYWYAKEVRLDRCYSAHTDFRLYPIPKDQRFVDFLPSYRQEIAAGSFPYSSEIRAPWSPRMPEPFVQERGPENYYILDGQLRVIRHWYHGILNLRVFLYRGQGSVWTRLTNSLLRFDEVQTVFTATERL